MKYAKALVFLLLVLVVIYLLGPRPNKVKLDASLPKINVSTADLDEYLYKSESKIENIKPENASRVVWLDSTKEKTEYAIVYLHGFSASGMEGEPVHSAIAKRYGANLYLPRLAGHGIQSEDAFLDLKPEDLIQSANEALAIGKLIGEKVILMSCSTGGTLSLFLAAENPEIHSLIMYSPNIDLAAKGSNVLVGPWGLQLARLMFKGKHRGFEATDEMKKYWTHRYRIEGLIALKQLVNATMTKETFKAVKQPVFVGYYYKDEENKDNIVSIARINEMFEQINTAEEQKVKIEFANAGNHVINSSLTSNELDGVIQKTEEFCEQVLGLVPIN